MEYEWDLMALYHVEKLTSIYTIYLCMYMYIHMGDWSARMGHTLQMAILRDNMVTNQQIQIDSHRWWVNPIWFPNSLLVKSIFVHDTIIVLIVHLVKSLILLDTLNVASLDP